MFHLQEEDGSGVVVRGLSTHVAATEEAALNLLFIGEVIYIYVYLYLYLYLYITWQQRKKPR